MTKPQPWYEQLSRYVAPVIVIGIGIYGIWDLIIPEVRLKRPTNLCTTKILDVAVLKSGSTPDQPPKRIQVPQGLPIAVPAGEQRIISLEVEGNADQSVMYRWQATYGKFASRITIENQSDYTAPRSLVNDTLTIEATVQGCSTAKRTLELAIVPSAKIPLSEEPLTAPTSFPSPTPTFPSTLPTVEP